MEGLLGVLTAVLLSILVGYYLLRYILFKLAEENTLFTFREAGEFKFIMSGKICIGVIADISNHMLDPEEGYDVIKGTFEDYARQLLAAREGKEEEVKGFIDRKLDEVTEEIRGKSDTDIKAQYGMYAVSAKEGSKFGDRKFVLKRSLISHMRQANEVSWFEMMFGVVWVGFLPHYVFEYNFSWAKYTRQKSEEDKDRHNIDYDMVRRNKKIDSLFFTFPAYALTIKDAETGAGSLGAISGGDTKQLEKVEVIAKLVWASETINPIKTLFRTAGIDAAGDWIIAVEAEIYSHMRAWISRRTYDELLQVRAKEEAVKTQVATPKTAPEDTDAIQKTSNHVDAVAQLLQEVINEINAIIGPAYGQIIKAIRIVDIQLKNPELQKSIDAIFTATRSAEAAVQELKRRKTLAAAVELEEAAPLIGRARGIKAIIEAGGKEIEIARHLSEINVFAPGNPNAWLDVTANLTGTRKGPGSENEPPPRTETARGSTQGGPAQPAEPQVEEAGQEEKTEHK